MEAGKNARGRLSAEDACHRTLIEPGTISFFRE